MSDKPQLRVEEITLTPQPLDAWRHALDLLIACAPGHPADVALHLRDAAMGMHRKPVVSEHASRLIQRLLILVDVQLLRRQFPADCVDALLHETPRANGKCLLTRQAGAEPLSAVEAARIIRGLGMPELRPEHAPETAQPARSHSQKSDHGHEAHQFPASPMQPLDSHQPTLLDGEQP